MELRARIAIDADGLDAFRHQAEALVARHATLSGVRRSDWFVNAANLAGIIMVVCADADAAGIAADLAGLEGARVTGLDILGIPSAAVLDCFAAFAPRAFAYDNGLGGDVATPTLGFSPDDIEIFTGFEIAPGALDAFKRHADELVAIVADKDPATPRYDWFYDASGRHGIAMDTYTGAQGMFAHMKNCHAAHEALLDHATMVTEFLGELPEEAMAAVAKYNPYILTLQASLPRDA